MLADRNLGSACGESRCPPVYVPMVPDVPLEPDPSRGDLIDRTRQIAYLLDICNRR
ncbi:MAG: hypothetical protein U0T81_01220 [Saprospiraceae bacterium]